MEETAENLKQLAKFGISEGISEIILTTRNDSAAETKANAAPFGIIWKNNKMFLRLFKGSKTYENLMREDYFAANMTDDAVLYAKSTFYDLEAEEFDDVLHITEIGNENTKISISVPVLKKADRFVLFKCVSRLEASDSVIIDIEPIEYFVLNAEKEGFVFNRGFHSVIEACIHLTRYELTKGPTHVDLIRHHQKIIQRCGRKNDKAGFSIVRRKLMEIEAGEDKL
ncbi:DUF447 family protein [Methanimicrococcus sp. OttesenSCG-928-J09]|nr:DUF447 family protein [Methanimicrococcus sp. OttesenSCG-928-J09]